MERSFAVPYAPSHHQRLDQWMFLDVPSDITVNVNGTCFSLHKFPLASKSGRIRKLIAEHKDADILRIDLLNLPASSDAFELVAKFCYGVHFDITSANVAQLLCVSEYLEMTDQYAAENLASRSEACLDSVICKSLEMSLEVLHQCEDLLPLADELKIVGRCVDTIASKACAEQMASSFSRLEYNSSGRLHLNKHAKSHEDWWVEGLSVLRVDLYERVIEAMKCRGIHPESIGSSLVHFAEKTFKKIPRLEFVGGSLTSERRLVVESIVSLLPVEKHAVPIGFLFGLIRSAMMLDCTMSCRQNLEQRIGSQLELASLDDLLIPCQNAGDTIFDVDTIHRVLMIFSQMDGSDEDGSGYDSDGLSPPSQTAMVKVANLVDSYLAEIAPDANLKLARFISIADTLPEYARTADDGIYRAIDIYLKTHQGLSDSERRSLCKLVNFEKLSDEASAHASHNDRLPLQTTVRMLYIEQMRLRNTLNCSYLDDNQKTSHLTRLVGRCALSADTSSPDNYASLRRENRELKLELARMRARLNVLERGHANMKQDLENSSSRKVLSSISKKIGKLRLFRGIRFEGASSRTADS